MNDFLTLVICNPASEADKVRVQEGLRLLAPFQTGMSIEDEMTILEQRIEENEDFDPAIAEAARAEARELHARARASGAITNHPSIESDGRVIVNGRVWIPLARGGMPPPADLGKLLVTNNINARDAHGRLSHVWAVLMIHKDEDEPGCFCAFNDCDERIHFLTHYSFI